MSDQKYREAKLTRELGMSQEQKEALAAFNHEQEWTIQCWNCRKPVTRKLSALHGPCPHCGVELSKRA